jgi:hypothetical protein
MLINLLIFHNAFPTTYQLILSVVHLLDYTMLISCTVSDTTTVTLYHCRNDFNLYFVKY